MNLFNYVIYGKHLVSDFEFPQLVKSLPEESGLPAEITITKGKMPDRYRYDKQCYSSIDKDVSYLSNCACYLYITGGSKIIYETKQGYRETNLNAYLLSWGLSMIFYQLGMLALHCSCVSGKAGAVLISGNSGCGKSTITSFLLENGYRLMADDMAVIDLSKSEALVSPAFPYQKICRDALMERETCIENMDGIVYIDEDKDKFLVPYKGDFSTDTMPVRAIVMLAVNSHDNVRSGELTGINKYYACTDAVFLKPLLHEKLYSSEIGESCLKLASKIPIYYIERPAMKDTKADVICAMKNLMDTYLQ